MARCRKILIATRNPAKVREIKAILSGIPVELLSLEEIDPGRKIPEPEETGKTFAENARTKATYYARASGMWALADDSGLVVDALNGEPGVRSARYALDECNDDENIDMANNAKLLRELTGIEDERRTARFICHLVLSDGHKTLIETTGVINGRITHQPRGENGFGYDPLFLVPELGRTTAELPPEEKNAISHRGQAVRKFAEQLRNLLDSPTTSPNIAKKGEGKVNRTK